MRHLRKSSFSEVELVNVYKTYIRPTVEYSAPIYHLMLTGEQNTQIELLQYFALRNIYGFEYSNRKLLELSGLPTLEERRKNMAEKFAKKRRRTHDLNTGFPPEEPEVDVYVVLKSSTWRSKQELTEEETRLYFTIEES